MARGKSESINVATATPDRGSLKQAPQAAPEPKEVAPFCTIDPVDVEWGAAPLLYAPDCYVSHKDLDRLHEMGLSIADVYQFVQRARVDRIPLTEQNLNLYIDGFANIVTRRFPGDKGNESHARYRQAVAMMQVLAGKVDRIVTPGGLYDVWFEKAQVGPGGSIGYGAAVEFATRGEHLLKAYGQGNNVFANLINQAVILNMGDEATNGRREYGVGAEALHRLYRQGNCSWADLMLSVFMHARDIDEAAPVLDYIARQKNTSKGFVVSVARQAHAMYMYTTDDTLVVPLVAVNLKRPWGSRDEVIKLLKDMPDEEYMRTTSEWSFTSEKTGISIESKRPVYSTTDKRRWYGLGRQVKVSGEHLAGVMVIYRGALPTDAFGKYWGDDQLSRLCDWNTGTLMDVTRGIMATANYGTGFCAVLDPALAHENSTFRSYGAVLPKSLEIGWNTIVRLYERDFPQSLGLLREPLEALNKWFIASNLAQVPFDTFLQGAPIVATLKSMQQTLDSEGTGGEKAKALAVKASIGVVAESIAKYMVRNQISPELASGNLPIVMSIILLSSVYGESIMGSRIAKKIVIGTLISILGLSGVSGFFNTPSSVREQQGNFSTAVSQYRPSAIPGNVIQLTTHDVPGLWQKGEDLAYGYTWGPVHATARGIAGRTPAIVGNLLNIADLLGEEPVASTEEQGQSGQPQGTTSEGQIEQGTVANADCAPLPTPKEHVPLFVTTADTSLIAHAADGSVDTRFPDGIPAKSQVDIIEVCQIPAEAAKANHVPGGSLIKVRFGDKETYIVPAFTVDVQNELDQIKHIPEEAR